MIPFGDLELGADGLVPAVIRHSRTADVLMVGYMDERAYRATWDSGFVHFWSRSRNELWKKGETSGNTLALVGMAADCDRDTLLVTATPAGPVCHTGEDTCFGPASTPSLGAAVDDLVAIIAQRMSDRPAGSYTAKLVDDPEFAARKVLEEAGEVAFAAKDVQHGGPPGRLVEEAVDELYHLLVLLAAHGIDVQDVADEVTARMVSRADS